MRNTLKAISADNKLDFYLDKNIIGKQELVQWTISHINTFRSPVFKPIELLNLLWLQRQYVLDNPDSPEPPKQPANPNTTLEHLNSLPLSPVQRHILYYFIIEWFGGVGSWYHKKTLRLIENEFKMFKGNTPEKDRYFKGMPGFYRLTFDEIKRAKKKFDKLTYPDKLKFWDENIVKDFHYSSSSIGFYLENDREIEDEGITPDRSITIYPKDKAETELHNRWLYNHILTNKENWHCNFEILKEKYFETIKGNPRAKEFTEKEIRAIEIKRDREKANMEQKHSIYFWGFYYGYQSVVESRD